MQVVAERLRLEVTVFWYNTAGNTRVCQFCKILSSVILYDMCINIPKHNKNMLYTDLNILQTM